MGRTSWPHRFAGIIGDRLGDRLDILAANAGVSKSANIEDTTVEDFDRLFAVNVRESTRWLPALWIPRCRTSQRLTPGDNTR
jgi:NAD(P)-dependent dehydrogenase (short-subunit alcohol dehydrogenase family)